MVSNRRMGLAAGMAATAYAQAATFDWSSIEPSKDLTYTPCYNGTFQCARLELPLDYENVLDGRKVAIAIQKLPATVDETDESFAGPVFMNPGGPGASGVDFGVTFNSHMQGIVDSEDRHFEIISFDPRGVGHSTPSVDCWEGDVLSRATLEIQRFGTSGLAAGDKSIGYNMGLQEGKSMRCKDADANSPIMGYVGTQSVARDMVEMLDSMEALRDAEASKRGLRNLRRDAEDVPRMNYVGFSYGTALGNYFASLFPGRVGRMVLDGVLDADDYSNGPGWTTNTVDTDEMAENFFQGCFEAGPLVCGMAKATDTSGSDISTRFYEFLAKVDEVPLGTTYNGQVVAISGEDFRYGLRTMLYAPLSYYTTLPFVIDAAMNGRPAQMVEALVTAQRFPYLAQNCPVETAPFAASAGVIDAQDAIICMDGEDVTDKDLAYWSDYITQQVNQSDISGAYWSTLRFACHKWQFPSHMPFRGPFETPEADSAIVEGKPAAPLLFLTNRWDPATPMEAAYRMSEGHPGSAVVVQDAPGHCAIPSYPSECINKIVQTYFANGTVPDGDVTCEAACSPWNPTQCTNSAGLLGAAVDGVVDGLKRAAGDVFGLLDQESNSLGLKRFPLGAY